MAQIGGHGVRILRELRRAKARCRRAFGDGRLLLCSYLGCGREWLYVPELSQKGVLVVVAAAQHSPALFVEVGYFTEGNGYAAAN